MRRKLSGIEAMLWSNGQRPIHFGILARVEGMITVDRLQKALALARLKYPMLAIRIESSDEHTLWCTSDQVDPISIQSIERLNDSDWQTLTAIAIEKLFPAIGPLIRFLVISSATLTDLVMICHHCLYDGLSAVYILRDILSYLGNPDQNILPVPVLGSIDDLLPASVIQEFQSNPSDVESWVPQASLQSNSPMGAEVMEQSNLFHILPWNLSHELTAALINRCHSEQTTVHSALSVALASAFSDNNIRGSSPIRTVSSPISLRDRLKEPIGEATGFYISGYQLCSISCGSARIFLDEARTFRKSLQSKMTPRSLFFMSYRATQSLANTSYTTLVAEMGSANNDKVPYDCSLTNLGNLDLPLAYGPFKLRGMYGPIVDGMRQECVIGVMTIHGQMSLVMTYHDPFLTSSEAHAIITRSIQILTEAVDSHR
jgi:NRPS condensation-like uncharacterized protein